MDDAGPASNHLMFQDVLDTLARLKRAHDADARGLRLDQNLLRLVYQQGVIDYYDPHNATAFVNFHIKFEPEMAMLMMAEFLSTGEMLPDDARYCFKWIDEAQKEKKLVSSAIFRPTNTTGALGDYWIHRLQVSRSRDPAPTCSRS